MEPFCLQAADGEWHHYVIVYTGEAIVVYLDAVLVGTEDFNGQWLSSLCLRHTHTTVDLMPIVGK